ncbi:ImmA/IrrE family metallo-endopeptidase [Streptomyces halstedii]|uniref:ImmA/IrrE family metallo-endopeptidase n=2 Tax=Streptomyces TaxID=1883 RepID=UPI00345FB96F
MPSVMPSVRVRHRFAARRACDVGAAVPAVDGPCRSFAARAGRGPVEVDAFAVWREGVPFVFLNTQKSAERGRFDAAHEFGHLVMHGSEHACSGPEAER